MTEQQNYRVIADRDKGDDPQWTDVHIGDRYVGVATERAYEDDPLVRIERPVPTIDEAKRMLMTHPHDGHGPNDTCRDCEANPAHSLPTREQIAEAWDRAREDTSIPRKRNGSMRPVDAFEAGFRSALTLIQNGADR